MFDIIPRPNRCFFIDLWILCLLYFITRTGNLNQLMHISDHAIIPTTSFTVASIGTRSTVVSSTNNKTVLLSSSYTSNDNAKIPGTFMDDKLYILGTRLTTSYDKLDNSLFFDMFGHAVGNGSSGVMGLARVDPGSSRLSYQEASAQPLFCRLPGSISAEDHMIRMEIVPQKSNDINTINVHLIWRCNLSSYLTRNDLLLLMQQKQQYVKISVFTANQNASAILTVDIPIDTLTVGCAGPRIKSKYQPSFPLTIARDGPKQIVLCVAGLPKSALLDDILPEFIQHHWNVGVDHFFLGVDLLEDLPYFEEGLSYYIDKGLVVLGTDHMIPELENVTDISEDLITQKIRKMRLYNQCLFHAKGISEFLAIWDIDELWMPPMKTSNNNIFDNTLNHNALSSNSWNILTFVKHLIVDDDLRRSDPYQGTMSLPEAVRSLQGSDGCLEWCYQTFSSYTVRPFPGAYKPPENMTGLEEQGFYYGGHPVRDMELNFDWQKPIIRTKYAHQASFHLGGSCRHSSSITMVATGESLENHDNGNPNNDHYYTEQFDRCPLLEERNESLGAMHHFLDLFYLRSGDEELQPPNENHVVDEYSTYLRPTTLKQLRELANTGKFQMVGATGGEGKGRIEIEQIK